MPDLNVTLLMAAAAGLIHFWHFYRCVKIRMGDKIMHGDGGNVLMGRRMRAHSNFVETTPLFLILLGLVEYNVGASMWLWATGYIFILGRMLHGIGMDKDGENWQRMVGTLTGIVPIVGLSAYALWLASSAA